MFDVHIRLTPRVLTPEQGQAILKKMSDAVPCPTKEEMEAMQNGGSVDRQLFGKVQPSWGEINVGDNLAMINWPAWLGELIKKTFPNADFDTINFMFVMQCPTRAYADGIQKWFEDFTAWANANDAEKAGVLKLVSVTIHDDTGANHGLTAI